MEVGLGVVFMGAEVGGSEFEDRLVSQTLSKNKNKLMVGTFS